MTFHLRLQAWIPRLLRSLKHSRTTHQIEEMIRCYGDLIFDLCESVLWNPQNTQVVFRIILQELRHCLRAQPYKTYERAWVLRIAYEKISFFAEKYARRLTAAEQIEIDSNPNVSIRLKNFDAYFYRLNLQDQILLLLRDKYGIPYPEISAAMQRPEGSLKISRQQALRTLEEWIWDQQ